MKSTNEGSFEKTQVLPLRESELETAANAPLEVRGLIAPMEELEGRIIKLSKYDGFPLHSRVPQEVMQDLLLNFAHLGLYKPMPQPMGSQGWERLSESQKARSEYRGEVHEELKGLMDKSDATFQELAIPFISGRVNNQTAFALLISIVDTLHNYEKQRISTDKDPQYRAPALNTLRKLVGLTRAYAESAYDAVWSSEKVFAKYFTAHK